MISTGRGIALPDDKSSAADDENDPRAAPGPSNFDCSTNGCVGRIQMMNKASVLLAAGVALLLSSHQADAFMAPAAMSLRAPSRMPVRPHSTHPPQNPY